ncbi:MAG: hypothetical protein RLZZ352_1523 [Pseudomonadota bacterium]|jgi:glucan phosphoethanolaminetransferase (alkaline phosphatase superfamily)
MKTNNQQNVKQWVHFVFWGVILFLPNAFLIAISIRPVNTLLKTIPFSFILFLGLLAWVKKPKLLLIILLPFLLLVPAEISYIVHYKAASSSHILGILSETNWTESLAYAGWNQILLVCLISGALFLSFVYSLRHLPAQIGNARAWTWLRWVFLITLLSIAWYSAYGQPDDFDLPASDLQSVNLTAQTKEKIFLGNGRPAEEAYGSSFPFGVLLRVWAFHEEMTHLREAAALLDQAPPPKVWWTSPAGRSAAPHNVVLVIGESSRADHWGLNGYQRQTTPLLASLNHLISFKNVVTPWTNTRRAVPVLIIGEQDTDHLAVIQHPSLLSIFKQAGYYTAWLSNQSPLGPHDSLIAMHAHQAERQVYTNPVSYQSAGATDDALLAPLSSVLNHSATNKFIILHLLGSHPRYIDRYPAAFGPFQPTLSNHAKNPEAIVNAYDNSIAFTDKVLYEIIKLLSARSDEKSLLFYISDHGQTLPSKSCQQAGHGGLSKSDNSVSALIWFSDEMLNESKSKFNQLSDKLSEPLYSPETVHTLLDLTGLAYSGYKDEWSWASKKWQPKHRWTGGPSHIRQLTENHSCNTMIN